MAWHHVAHAADRADRVGAELAAEIVDVHLDGVAFDFVTPTVESFLELRLGERRPRPLQQRRKQRELAL
jgi:hypothetical protein